MNSEIDILLFLILIPIPNYTKLSDSIHSIREFGIESEHTGHEEPLKKSTYPTIHPTVDKLSIISSLAILARVGLIGYFFINMIIKKKS